MSKMDDAIPDFSNPEAILQSFYSEVHWLQDFLSLMQLQRWVAAELAMSEVILSDFQWDTEAGYNHIHP